MKRTKIIEKGISGERIDIDKVLKVDGYENMYTTILAAALAAKEISKKRDRHDKELGYIKFHAYKPLNQALKDIVDGK